MKFIIITVPATHQTDEDAEELHDVSISNWVKASHEGVANGDSGTDDDGYLVVHV